MSDIPTWHERAMAHPDHQFGMISEDMIRARMGEEIADLRAKVEELRDQIYESIPKWQSNEMQREINRLRDARTTTERKRDEARAEVEKLREALTIMEGLREALLNISQYETSAPAGFEWDIVVDEIVEIARKALEAKS